MNLNEHGLRRCQQLMDQQAEARVAVFCAEGGARLIDCGVNVAGGLEAGRALAETCMAGLGQVQFVDGHPEVWPGPQVCVTTDHPVAACLASQYAGWPVGGEKFYAMGSGPMRSLRGREALFDDIGFLEQNSHSVGCLESGRMPSAEICVHIAEECQVEPADVTLLIAPTSSIAGTVQVVARSVETALHKMHEIGFDVSTVLSGFGTAPLPPVAADDLTAIGWTNDAVLYGGRVTLWVATDDDTINQLGPKIPSSSSEVHGRPFAEIFEQFDRDFYAIDPLLFSPAVVSLVNLATGRTFVFGETAPRVLQRSFSKV